MADERMGLVTGRVEWSRVDYTRDGRERFVTTRFAGNDILETSRGDERGIVVLDDQGRGEPSAMGAWNMLYRGDGERWHHWDWDLLAEVAMLPPEHPGVSDPRALGAAAGDRMGYLPDILWVDHGSLPGSRKYTERTDGSLHIVSSTSNDVTTTYWIDSKRGWNPVRVTAQRDGKIVAESRTTLKQFDGYWFPEVIAVYSASLAGGHQPSTVPEGTLRRVQQARTTG